MASEEFGAGVWGGILAGLSAIGIALYKITQGFKENAKGDQIDERISQFTTTLQGQLDKANARADNLQAKYDALAHQYVSAQARAESLALQVTILRAKLQQSLDAIEVKK